MMVSLQNTLEMLDNDSFKNDWRNSGPQRYVLTKGNHSHKTWNTMEHHGTPWNTMEHHGTSWNTMEHYGHYGHYSHRVFRVNDYQHAFNSQREKLDYVVVENLE